MKYRHFKGGDYEFIGDATHSETLERLVVYRDDEGCLWVRPADMFYGLVDVDGKKVRRFKPVTEAHPKMDFINYAFTDSEIKHRLYDPTGPQHGRTIIPKQNNRSIQANEIQITQDDETRRYVYKGDHDLDGAKRMERV